MSASLRNQQGFSLPEVMLAMVLMVMIVTALSGFQRTLMNSLASRNQYQQLWRHGWQQTQLRAILPVFIFNSLILFARDATKYDTGVL